MPPRARKRAHWKTFAAERQVPHMAHYTQADRLGTPQPAPTAWAGWIFFAGVLMAIGGALNVIAGLVALVKQEYYLVTDDGLLVPVDYAVWGWTLLIYGAAMGTTGVGLLAGQGWARVTGVLLALVNALLHVAFLAASPVWSTIMIAFAVVVIYSLIAHGREMRPVA
jgi:hypothetical protein